MTPSSERPTMILGMAATAGIASGPAYLCQCGEATEVPRRSIADTELVPEIGRLDGAVAEAAAQLDALAEQVRQRSSGADNIQTAGKGRVG